MKKELINKFYELKENGELDKFLETEVKEVVKESYENSLTSVSKNLSNSPFSFNS